MKPTTRKNFHVFNPIVDFTRVLIQCTPSFSKWPKVGVYYFKWFFFEPFRYVEKIWLNLCHSDYQLRTDPVIVLGYYRSGTTHLQEVMMVDKRFAYQNFYQTYFSTAFNLTEKIFVKTFGWIMTNIVNYKHPAHQIPFEFHLPGEEDVGMVASGFRFSANWGQVFPSHFRHFFSKFVYFEGVSPEEYEKFKEGYIDFMRRVSLANGDKQLILKSPPSVARIRFLKEIYPNAKFIYIRRNPFYVIRSNQKLWNTFRDQGLENFTDEEAKEHIFWSMDKCLGYYEEMKGDLRPDELIEIDYEDFLADPMGKVKAIYSQLNLGLSAETQKDIEHYLSLKHGQNRDNYRYTAEEIKEIQTRMAKWIRPTDAVPQVSASKQ